LTVILAGMIPAFAMTQFIVSRHRAGRESLAADWSRRGRADLPTRPIAAVTEFETALSYAPDRTSDRFLLATALVAAGHPIEASAQLQALVTEDPADSDVNLELARIAANGGTTDNAIRYYHAAIDGVWRTDALVARRNARIELARLLMARGQAVRAQAELIALIDELPEESELLTDVAGLLAEAGASARALGLARRALVANDSNMRAAQLAGELEFRGGDFSAAARDLSQARASGALGDAAEQMLEVSRRVLALDPYAGRLNVRTRAQRSLQAVAIARLRFDRCKSVWISDERIAPKLDHVGVRLEAAEKRSAVALERDADLIDDNMASAFDVERLPSGHCGADTIDDRALAAIATQHPPPSQ
jgi:tetratricopeptide (TPR) repeat protein